MACMRLVMTGWSPMAMAWSRHDGLVMVRWSHTHGVQLAMHRHHGDRMHHVTTWQWITLASGPAVTMLARSHQLAMHAPCHGEGR
jgi:hypothetical protein